MTAHLIRIDGYIDIILIAQLKTQKCVSILFCYYQDDEVMQVNANVTINVTFDWFRIYI